MKFFALASALTAISAVSAETFTVQVGANGGLTYEPTTVTAAEGDVIAFQFLAKNHTVTQSTFADPCTASGVDSGYFPVAADATEIPQWSFTVNNASAPLWFFCAQTGHCQAGMVFAVNPTPERTFEAFQAAAMGQSASASGSATGADASATGGASGGGATSATDAAADPSATDAASGALSRLSFNNVASALAVVGLVAGCTL